MSARRQVVAGRPSWLNRVAIVTTATTSNTTPMTWGVVVKNDLAFVNDINGGLFIVRIERRKAPLVP